MSIALGSLPLAGSTAGFVSLTEHRVSTSDVSFGKIDAVIGFASFEARSLAITQSRAPRAKVAAVFQFSAPGSDNGRSKAARTIADHFEKYVDSVHIIALPLSTEIELVQERIRKLLLGWREMFGRSFTLGFDISCCPKIYIAAVLGFGLSTGIISHIVLHYAEADYSVKRASAGTASERQRSFTDGAWRPAQVPYLEGEFVAGRPRHAIVSMGEEAPAVEKLIRRYDPETITLLRPAPGIDVSFQQNTDDASRRIQNLYGSVSICDANPFSAVAALNQVHKICRARGDVEDLMVFLFGTKPHAVAICLAGIAHPQLQVIFRVPHRYNEGPVSGSGWSWLYNVKDLSNPTTIAYFESIVSA